MTSPPDVEYPSAIQTNAFKLGVEKSIGRHEGVVVVVVFGLVTLVKAGIEYAEKVYIYACFVINVDYGVCLRINSRGKYLDILVVRGLVQDDDLHVKSFGQRVKGLFLGYQIVDVDAHSLKKLEGRVQLLLSRLCDKLI